MKCKSFPLRDVPVVDLTFATRFLAVFLFLRVKGSRPMTFQFLTVTMFQSSKANDGFVDQKEFKTNSTYTFDSLLFHDLAVRVIDLYIDNVRALLNSTSDYLLVTHKGTQYAKLGDAMSKLVYFAINTFIQPGTDKLWRLRVLQNCLLKIKSQPQWIKSTVLMLQRFMIKSRRPIALPLRVKFPEKSYQDKIVILQMLR